MHCPLRRSSWISSIAAALITAVVLTLTGCGVDASQGASAGYSPVGLSGIIHGGPNPVAGATVTLYATQSVATASLTSANCYGYCSAGLKLGSTTTTGSGSFTFGTLTNSCPSGQFAYITSAAGNTGALATNSNSLLMAAIGPCSSLSSSTSIWIDEPTTIAAAYALGNFMSVSGTGSSMVVGVSAPVNNNGGASNGTAGACAVTSGVTTSCYAVGLAHAFLNAANLVNASNINGITTTAPTGQVYASPPSNSTTSLSSSTQPALLNQVPRQLINSLANSVQACVNSTGTTGTSDTTSNCGVFFTNTTVSTSYSSNATYTAKPSNTLQALVNLAKFPYMTSTAVTNIYNLGGTTSFYEPTLTSAPPDWTVAILWRSYGSGANQMGTVYYATTDINDNVYATALTAPATGSISGVAPFIANALTSDGAGIWSAPATISTNTTNVCTAYGGTALLDPPCLAATDALGHLWVANGQADTAQSGVYTAGYLAQVNTSTGAVTQFTLPSPSTDFPLGLAVDKSNDLFFTTSNNSGTNLWEFPQGSTSSTSPTAVSFGGVAYASSHTLGGIAFDTTGDFFGAHNAGGGIGYSYGTNNTGVFPAENFSSTAISDCNYCSGAGLNEGINSEPSSAMVDASGNFWFEGKTGLMEMTAAGVAPQTGAINYTLGSSNQVMRLASMDGSGTIFVPDANDSVGSANPLGAPVEPLPVLRIFNPAFPTQLTVAIAGCNLGTATGNAACVTTNPNAPSNQLFYQAFNAAIDSTGSMWVSSGGNDAVIQIIGLAAPTWPQASYLHPAVMPQ